MDNILSQDFINMYVCKYIFTQAGVNKLSTSRLKANSSPETSFRPPRSTKKINKTTTSKEAYMIKLLRLLLQLVLLLVDIFKDD